MRKMFNDRSAIHRIPALLAIFAIILSVLALPAVAGEGEEAEMKPAFTRVGLWDIKRSSWGEFVEMYKAFDKPIMERLLAEGVISEYGIDSDVIHRPEGYTHSMWFTTDSMADMARVYEAWDRAGEELGEEKRKEMDEKFEGMILKHRDYILRSEHMKARTAEVEHGYYHASMFRVKKGENRDFLSYYNNRWKSVCDELLASGDIVAYGRTEEEIVTHKPGGVSVWYIVDSAAGLDTVRAAFEADWAKMDEEGRRARWTSIMEFVEEGSYRENLTHIIHMGIKAR